MDKKLKSRHLRYTLNAYNIREARSAMRPHTSYIKLYRMGKLKMVKNKKGKCSYSAFCPYLKDNESKDK